MNVNVRNHVKRIEIDPKVAAAEAAQIAEEARLDRLRQNAARHLVENSGERRIVAVKANCTATGWKSICQRVADGLEDGDWTEAQVMSGEIYERLFAELQ